MRKSRSMKRKRKQYSGAFKAKVGLEALTGVKTTAQIARENDVHPSFCSAGILLSARRFSVLLWSESHWFCFQVAQPV